MKKSIIIIPAFLFLALGIVWVVLDSSSPTGFSIKQLNPFANCTDVNVSYEKNESYDADLKYQIVENSRDTIVKDGNDEWAVAVLKVQNADLLPGKFTVVRLFETAEKGKVSFNLSQDIAPGESKEFRSEYDISNGEQFSASYLIFPDKKKATRIVTNYRLEKRCE
ncbi:MAG: hypothetical protein V1866_00510 [archaeon]